MTTNDLNMLRAQWSDLYSNILPALARARDTAQPRWPVTLDHCFARIILDNTIGRGVLQWDNVIKKPAVKSMDARQFKEAIELGEAILKGAVDLVELDKKSLQARGKGEGKYKKEAKTVPKPSSVSASASASPSAKGTKRLRDPSSTFAFASTNEDKRSAASPPQKKQRQSTLSFTSPSPSPEKKVKSAATVVEILCPSRFDKSKAQSKQPSASDPDICSLLDKIASHSGLTPYRKRLYSTLLSVPLGNYTTYAAMARYLESSARAVGNGMRNNPFAPDVPCHRVLAADGSLGGFHGHWGKEGKYATNKIGLLDGEGVKFDSRGKVKGPVFTDLVDLSRDRKIDVGIQA